MTIARFALLLATVALAAAQTASDDFTVSAGTVGITPLGHAGVMMRTLDNAIYVDPVGAHENLPVADLIPITHTHPDHLDPKLLPKLMKPGTVFIGPAAGRAVYVIV